MSNISKAQRKVLERLATGDALDYVSWGTGRASIGFTTVNINTFESLKRAGLITGKKIGGEFSYEYTITPAGRAALETAGN